jgi:phospholipase/lecithinase/hemolysin
MKRILAFWLLLFICIQGYALPFKQIVFFGDSLSDNGNLYQSIKLIPKSPPYYNGRFSNGPTWAENLAQHYYTHYYVDSANYAYGGATTITHSLATDSYIAPITLEGELNSYYFHSLFTDKTKVLYVFWIGANDYLFDREPNINELTNAVVDKIIWAITSLINQGGQDFLILNLPDVGVSPFAKANQLEERLHIICNLHNQKLANRIQKLQKTYPTIKFVTVDTFYFLSDLTAHPEKYNQKYGQAITNVSDACWKGGVFAKNLATIQSVLDRELQGYTRQNFSLEVMGNTILNMPDLNVTYQLGISKTVPCSKAHEYLFWDELHPSAALHQIVSGIVMQTLADAGQG